MAEQIPAIPSGVYSSGVLAGKKKSTPAQKKASAAAAAAKTNTPAYIRAQIAKWRKKIKAAGPKSRYVKGWTAYVKMLEGKLRNIGG